jgi:TonB family protein
MVCCRQISPIKTADYVNRELIMVRPHWIISALLLAGLAPAAHAEWRCDCTTIVASCAASVAVKGNRVEITTDQQACARVDYFIDGLPFVALAVDGSDRQDWIAQTDDPKVMVQSCQVCADRTTQSQPTARATAPDAADAAGGEPPIAPLIQVPPEYPASAKARGVEGYVVVEFKLSPFGTVEEARVVEAKPTRVFDQAALAAIRRWRYPAALADEPQRTVTERLEFKVGDFIWSEPTRSSRQVATSRPARRAGPQNQCVKEGVAYNFGDSVEVGLINACVDPVVLFSCAVGTGKDLGRWRCAPNDPQAVVLVRAGEGRAQGDNDGGYVENHFLMRPPNTQYWWIACNEADARCNEAARDWSAQMDGRPATVDPAQLARVPVARSY